MKRLLVSSLLLLFSIYIVSCARVDVAKTLEESQVAAENGEWEQVHANLKKIIEGNNVTDLEGADRLYAFYIQSKIKLNQFEDALVTAAEAHAKYPKNKLINYQLGKLYYEKGMRLSGEEGKAAISQAVPYLEHAHLEDPYDVNTMTMLLTASLESNDPKALKWFEIASQMDAFKDNSDFHNQWGKAYSQRSMHPEAIRKYITSMRLNETNAVAYLNAGVTYDKHMNYPKLARKYYIKYLQVLKLNNESENNISSRKKVQGRLRELTRL